jgi:hypothetical protein
LRMRSSTLSRRCPADSASMVKWRTAGAAGATGSGAGAPSRALTAAPVGGEFLTPIMESPRLSRKCLIYRSLPGPFRCYRGAARTVFVRAQETMQRLCTRGPGPQVTRRQAPTGGHRSEPEPEARPRSLRGHREFHGGCLQFTQAASSARRADRQPMLSPSPTRHPAHHTLPRPLASARGLRAAGPLPRKPRQPGQPPTPAVPAPGTHAPTLRH